MASDPNSRGSFMSMGFWIDHRGRLLGVFGLVFAALIAVLYVQTREDSYEGDGWRAMLEPDRADLIIQKHIAIETPVKGTTAEPWALYVDARNEFLDKEPQVAREMAAQLQANFPDHMLNQGSKVTDLIRDIEAEAKWMESHPEPEKSPQVIDSNIVTVSTVLGDIKIGLYPDQAPVAVSEFLALARDGGLAQGHFDEAQAEAHILLTPKGREQNDDSEEEEETPPLDRGIVPDRNLLSHYEGAVSFYRNPGAIGTDARPRIAIYLRDAPHKDDTEVVFGKLLSGVDLLRQVSTRDTEEGGPKLKEPLAVEGITEADTP